jgi:hypothetical protein
MSHHYAFHVSDAEFDAILQRVEGAMRSPDPRDLSLDPVGEHLHRAL